MTWQNLLRNDIFLHDCAYYYCTCLIEVHNYNTELLFTIMRDYASHSKVDKNIVQSLKFSAIIWQEIKYSQPVFEILIVFVCTQDN